MREADAVRHVIGYMPDFFGVYKDMEVTEYLDFFGACYKIPTAQREKTVNDVLELVGLTEKKGALIGALSRGMQQRLGLARVLIHDPQLLLLDEPASGLDPRARIEMMAILQELQRLGKTIIISSHILSELQTLCNRVAIIEKGRLIYSGAVQGVRDQVSQGRVVWVRVSTDTAQAIELLKARQGDCGGGDHGRRNQGHARRAGHRAQHRGGHPGAWRRQADRAARGRGWAGGSVHARDARERRSDGRTCRPGCFSRHLSQQPAAPTSKSAGLGLAGLEVGAAPTTGDLPGYHWT